MVRRESRTTDSVIPETDVYVCGEPDRDVEKKSETKKASLRNVRNKHITQNIFMLPSTPCSLLCSLRDPSPDGTTHFVSVHHPHIEQRSSVL